MRRHFYAVCFAFGVAGGSLPSTAAVVASPVDGEARIALDVGDRDRVNPGTILGVVVDAESGEPLPGTYVRLRELGRNELSHRDGSFHFLEVGPRGYTIVAQRIGYAPAEMRVRVDGGDTLHVTLELSPSALEVPGVVVTATGRERGVADTYRPTALLGDAELRRRLESSVAATVAHLPGLSQQYNGPAFVGPIRESDPAQGTTGRIVIFDWAPEEG